MNQPTHNFIIAYFDILVKLKKSKALLKAAKKTKSQRSDSNRQPLVYKTRALPLSYVGVNSTGIQLNPILGFLSNENSRLRVLLVP